VSILKKIVMVFLSLILLLIVAVVIAANSSYVIGKGLDAVAPKYGITYKRISGNILTGITVEKIEYQHNMLAQSLRFSWNPSKLLYLDLAINDLEITNLDYSVVELLIASFSDEKKEHTPIEKEEGGKDELPPVSVSLSHFHIDLLPFEKEGISFLKSSLDIDGVAYSADGIDVASLHAVCDTDITDFTLDASFKQGDLQLQSIKIDVHDPDAILALVTSQKGEEEQEGTKDPNKTETSPFLPKEVHLDDFRLSLQPFSYQEMSVTKCQLVLNDLWVDVAEAMARKRNALTLSSLQLDLLSSIAKTRIEATLEKEGVVHVRELRVGSLDTAALTAMFSSTDSADENESNTTNSAQEGESIFENGLVPQRLVLDRFHLDIRQRDDLGITLEKAEVSLSDVVYDLKEQMVQKGEIALHLRSDMANIEEKGNVEKNRFKGRLTLFPHDMLYSRYNIPLRHDAFSSIPVDISATPKEVNLSLRTNAKALLKVVQDTNRTKTPFNVNLDNLSTKLHYTIATGELEGNSTIALTTPYTQDASLVNRFVMKGETLGYEGSIQIAKVYDVNGTEVPLLSGLKMPYHGNKKMFESSIETKGLKGKIVSKDLKASLQCSLQTRKPVQLASFVTLPEALVDAEASVKIDVPINLKKPLPIRAKAGVTSNVVNIATTFTYGEDTTLDATVSMVKNSLLYGLDEKVEWKALMPMNLHLRQMGERVDVTLNAQKLSAQAKSDLKSGRLEGQLRLAGLQSSVTGNMNGELLIESDIDSFSHLRDTVTQFYALKNLPKVEGALSLSVHLAKGDALSVSLHSPKVSIHTDRNTVQRLDNLTLSLKKRKDTLELSRYDVTYNTMHFFANRPSRVILKGTQVQVPELWVNDALKISADVDLKRMQGSVDAVADRFHFSQEMIDLDAKINIHAVLDGNRTDVKGKVTILGGNIYYDLGTKNFPSDSDILIVQEMKKKEPNPFMDHLSLQINVDSQKPLVYKQGPVDVKANVSLGIHKAPFADFMVIGSIDLLDGGSYIFEGKRFVLKKSHIYLTGDPSKPILDLTVKYRSLRHLISIHVSGTPATPTILFSSVPSLKKEQILSIILFDSEEGAGTNDANDMMKMMGGAMAKSALNDLGVQIDHLVFGEGNSVEVGKKLTDKTTVIYINGEIPKVEVKYDYSPHVEIVVGASERSESLDVVYRKDFNMRQDSDIVIKGR